MIFRLNWFIRRLRRWLTRGLKYTLGVVLLLVLLTPEWPLFHSEEEQLQRIVQLRQFDYLGWELQALWSKGSGLLGAGHWYLPADAQPQVVLSYLALIEEAHVLSQQIEHVYSDLDVADPGGETAAQQADWEALRAEVEAIQPIAEAVVQDQIAAVLVDEGFGFLGQAWPPVLMHVTPLPSLLVVSPRGNIERKYGVPLVHGVTAPERDALEAAVFSELDSAALVVNIGGMATYPAMVLETSDVNFLLDVTAHEWAHHWLGVKPLGLQYGAGGEMVTINETVASIVGKEVGLAALARYYPERVPQRPPLASPPVAGDVVTAPQTFDFRAVLRDTRVQVDSLLAEGQVVEAEVYMQEQQRYLADNGQVLRKLNQAYFAFYGAYADTAGAGGTDRIGPMVVAVREASPSLRSFMDTVAGVTSVADLEAIYAQMTAS